MFCSVNIRARGGGFRALLWLHMHVACSSRDFLYCRLSIDQYRFCCALPLQLPGCCCQPTLRSQIVGVPLEEAVSIPFDLLTPPAHRPAVLDCLIPTSLIRGLLSEPCLQSLNRPIIRWMLDGCCCCVSCSRSTLSIPKAAPVPKSVLCS